MKKIILLALATIAANQCSNKHSNQNPENQKQKKYFLPKFIKLHKACLRDLVKKHNEKNTNSLNYYDKRSTL